MQNSPLAAAAVKAQALLHALLVNFAGPSREWNSAFAEADILHMLRTGCGDSNYLSGSPETPKKIRQPNVDLRLIPAMVIPGSGGVGKRSGCSKGGPSHEFSLRGNNFSFRLTHCSAAKSSARQSLILLLLQCVLSHTQPSASCLLQLSSQCAMRLGFLVDGTRTV
eukprot:3582799-Rhodomonas_salina.2